MQNFCVVPPGGHDEKHDKHAASDAPQTAGRAAPATHLQERRGSPLMAALDAAERLQLLYSDAQQAR